MNLKTLSPSRIIVGLSGGVDSSVAAYLLKKAGHEVEAIFMKNWEGDDKDTFCSAALDLADAQAAADIIGIPLHFVNFADQYWERVFAQFLEEYQKGRTPNPDILCNKEIKFRAFLDYALLKGADYIATGHYVRSEQKEAKIRLLKGSDKSKDQSYFLYALSSQQLAKSIFPIGDLTKTEVRKIAKDLGLANHAKKDSTGICFIGERKFKTFLQDFLPAKKGLIKTSEGEIIGEHDGLMFYTLGQRQGLKIGGKKDKSQAPWYVAKKDLTENTLIVVQGEMHPALFTKTLHASELHFINEAPTFPVKLMAKVRYRQNDEEASLERLANGTYRISFDQAQRAITPGQSVVFYQDDICLGGGIIEH